MINIGSARELLRIMASGLRRARLRAISKSLVPVRVTMQSKLALTALLFTVLFAPALSAGVIDFNSLGHGTVVNDQFVSAGVAISADNPHHDGSDYAVAYDTIAANTPDNTHDPDLEGPSWGNSNIPNINSPGLVLGRILIIQENDPNTSPNQTDGCAGETCTYPDDEGRRNPYAGSLFFDFDTAITSFGFDLIDVEGAEEFENAGGFAAVFFDAIGGELARIGFGTFIGRDSASFGNNSVNRISPINFVSDLRLDPSDQVMRVEINMGGSGGVDNVNWTVPEPTTIALLGIGLLGLGFRSRRKAH
jgi:hypothetical protein